MKAEWWRSALARLVICLVMTAVAVAAAPHEAAGWLAPVAGGVSMPVLMGAIAPLIVPRTRMQLEELANPQGKGVSEAVPWILYDTQEYTSTATTTLNFYQTQQSDRTLSNLLQGGALTEPNYFEIYNLGFDVLLDMTTVAGGETGALDDIAKLMLVGRPIFTLTIQDKNYGPFPLSFLHTSGGPHGFGWGTFSAPESVQYGNNSVPDGGWNWRGSVVIQPKVGFSVQVQWNAAQTLAAGNTFLRFWMAGCLHRAVR